MKETIKYILLILLMFTITAKAQEKRTPQIKTGFDAMSNIEQLPLLFPNGTLTKQPLAYDATGQNWDHHFLAAFTQYVDSIKQPDGSTIKEYVIFDEYGPGVLYRQQMNAWYDRSKIPNGWLAWGESDQPRGNANIRYYFDDEKEPRIDMHLKDFFGTKKSPYTEPLAFVDSGYLFANLYYPFAFKKRLKVTLRPNAKSFEEMDTKWYQYTSLSFPADYKLETWKGIGEKEIAVINQWNKRGENPINLTGCKKIVTSQSIKNTETKTIADIKNSGSIVGLKINITPYAKEVFYHTQIKIYWDGNKDAAIDMPLSYLFGAGGKDYEETAEKVFNKSLATLMFGFDKDKGSFYNYWPMPFWKSAKIVLENNSGTDISNLICELMHKPSSVANYDADKTGYFYAKRTTDADPDTIGFRGVAFEENGKGHVVGLVFYSDRYDMDGDEFTYIDDSKTPQIHGSGTEDDHNQGWGGRAYQKPLWGGLVNGYHGAYRIYLNDCYVFNKNILITYEYSLTKPQFVNGGKTDVVTFYYKSKATSGLLLTDELDIGNHFDEKRHNYEVNKLTWKRILKDDYDGYERNLNYGSYTDDGKAFNGSSRFTVTIDPANNGVKLRKRINRNGNGVQTADVFVDGKKIERPWHIVIPSLSTGKGTVDGWYDSDFEIPSSNTKGKNKIDIEVRFVASPQKNEINEFYYWIYSYR
ncbi:DUF2961 domain-containing protein [Ferruginibacter sp.]|nr:DUF2961 domain-containing protein [Ferruginibacter sp.]